MISALLVQVRKFARTENPLMLQILPPRGTAEQTRCLVPSSAYGASASEHLDVFLSASFWLCGL